ncbi:hypothetical protein [Spirillospora sp. NBC_01491]|uniref:hypothetical protein n=1 Tax=Spirillospora sp. NBC_01491 TaxID=2976007 RepID=UPI002E3209CC|nr:hypothetical protein [Spirillospora sp. NBC_01491]
MRRAAGLVARGAAISLAGLAVAAAVVVLVAVAAPGLAVSDGFWWGSAVAAVLLQLGLGYAGTRRPLRYSASDLYEPPRAVAGAGPVLVAVAAHLGLAVQGEVTAGVLPMCAAVLGAAAALILPAPRRKRPRV